MVDKPTISLNLQLTSVSKVPNIPQIQLTNQSQTLSSTQTNQEDSQGQSRIHSIEVKAQPIQSQILQPYNPTNSINPQTSTNLLSTIDQIEAIHPNPNQITSTFQSHQLPHIQPRTRLQSHISQTKLIHQSQIPSSTKIN